MVIFAFIFATFAEFISARSAIEYWQPPEMPPLAALSLLGRALICHYDLLAPASRLP